MAQIDNYLRHVVRFGARGMVLKSGQHVMLRFADTDRYASQTTPHVSLLQMIAEIADAKTQSALKAGRQAYIEYPSEGMLFHISVTPEGNSITVMIDLKPQAGGNKTHAAHANSSGSSANYSEDSAALPIERTQYETSSSAPKEEELPIERHQYEDPSALPFPAKAQPIGRIAAAAPSSAPPASASSDSTVAPTARAEPAASSQQSDFIDKLLLAAKEADASDLHLSTGNLPQVRSSGQIISLKGFEVLKAEVLFEHLMAIAPEKNRLEFEERNDTDFSYAIPNVSRFRVNVFRDRKGPGAVLRTIPYKIPSAKQLGLPSKVLDLCNLSKGLVVVTGPTGSGKSTTLAALINHINETLCSHIITIEDPIEFIHENKKCLVNQREIRTHTSSFKDALRAALREDPDIVLVGEMRDLETIAIAVETAETGHLVFGTLHTTTAPGTVDRIVDQFPTDRQEQIRMMLAESLQGVIAQVLCRKKGGGRVAAFEILFGSSAVSNLIREKKTFQLFSLMQTQRKAGMRTMNDSLIELVRNKLVDPLEAYVKAVNKLEFKNMLARDGISIDSAEQ